MENPSVERALGGLYNQTHQTYPLFRQVALENLRHEKQYFLIQYDIYYVRSPALNMSNYVPSGWLPTAWELQLEYVNSQLAWTLYRDVQVWGQQTRATEFNN